MAESAHKSKKASASIGGEKKPSSTVDQTYVLLKVQESLMFVGVVLEAFLLLALGSYHQGDPGWSHTGISDQIHNEAGSVGAWSADFLMSLFGAVTWLVPSVLAYFIYILFRKRTLRSSLRFWHVTGRVTGVMLIFACPAGLAFLHFHHLGQYPATSGGIVGEVLVSAMLPAFGLTGTTLLLMSGFWLGFTMITGVSWFYTMDTMGRWVVTLGQWIKDIFTASSESLREYMGNRARRRVPHGATRHNSSRYEFDRSMHFTATSDIDDEQPKFIHGDASYVGSNVGVDEAESTPEKPVVDDSLVPLLVVTDDAVQEELQDQDEAAFLHNPQPLHERLNDEEREPVIDPFIDEPMPISDLPFGSAIAPEMSDEEFFAQGTLSSELTSDNPADFIGEDDSLEALEAAAQQAAPVVKAFDAEPASSALELDMDSVNTHEAVGQTAQKGVDADDDGFFIGADEPQPATIEEPEVDFDFTLFDEPTPAAPQPEMAPEPVAVVEPEPAFEPEPMVVAEPELTIVPTSAPAAKPVYSGLPSVNLLDNARRVVEPLSEDEIEAMSRLLEQRLQEFNVQVQVRDVFPGPVITRFEVELAAGTKASKITNLATDLARSMAVSSVRVVEVIAGKTYVGIEIPNANRQIVYFKNMVESERFQHAKSPLSLALGEDISGLPVVVDVCKMPHLLVAGTTGSGKSVGINGMILSMLFKASPEEVRMIMIDPKMLELSVYDGIPHLLAPVVTDMKEAANALRWCVAEMERRYKMMAAVGVRSLDSYNAKVKEHAAAGQPLKDSLYELKSENDWAPDLEPEPYIVVVVDEFSDMIMMVGKKVEELITRIAQKARAAGIHLILATQRPSVDVITGLIKANIPTRISFQVSSKIDSRTILDQGGAEQLLGHGDMLYLPPGTSFPMRVHGAYMTDDDVHRIVADWCQRGTPEYVDEIINGSFESNEGSAFSSGLEDSEQDPLYDQAVEIVITTRKASVSAMQRQLKVGYNRAARMVEAMEAAGLVSPPLHNGNREVIVPPRGA